MTCTTNGFVYGWDQTWSHFWGAGDTGKEIEWLKIKLTPENRKVVLDILKKIHVPGEVTEQEVTVYGYRTDVDYRPTLWVTALPWRRLRRRRRPIFW